MRKIAAAMLGFVLIGGSGVALAQNVTDQQIQQNLEAQGYRDIHISRHEKSHVDVRATKNGQAERLAVNPQTGAVSPDTDNDKD
jgi:hypothetical protein